MLRLSKTCGVVITRRVRGMLRYGSLVLVKSKGGIFGKSGFDSPNVKKKSNREKPMVNSLTIRDDKTRRKLSARLLVFRNTSPRGGKPGNTCGRPFSRSP